MSFVQHAGDYVLTAGTSATSHTSSALANSVNAGDFLAVWSSTNGTGTQNTLTDSLGNTYTKILQVTNIHNEALWVCYSVASGGAPTYTLTCSANFNTWLLGVDEWNGIGNPVDKTASATGTTSTSLSSGTTAATTTANELVLVLFGAQSSNTSTTASTPSGYTALTALQGAFGGTEMYLWPFYTTVSSTGAQSATTTISAAPNESYRLIATFPLTAAVDPFPAGYQYPQANVTTF